MRKITTQECTSIDVGQFRKMMSPFFENRHGVLGSAGDHGSIGFCLRWEGQSPIVTLRYAIDREMVVIRIPLVTTRTQFGGRRWWFKCPLAVDGTPCHRRAGKLFLPAGERFWGCRECHGLAYRSSQEAHQLERLSARWGLPISDFCSLFLRLMVDD